MRIEPRKRGRQSVGARLGRVRWAMQVCSEIAESVPARDDTLLQKAIKTASIAEVVLTHVEGEESVVERFAGRLGLSGRTSRQFVNLFFSTPLRELFELRRIKLGEDSTVVKATRDDVVLYFVEHKTGLSVRYDDDFFFEGKVEFDKILDVLWERFEGRIYAEVRQTFAGSDIRYASFPPPRDPVFGSAPEATEAFVAKHRRMQIDRVSRTYLFVGEPGTGKSTMALRVAEQIGRRILRLAAESLAGFQAEEMGFLLGALAPDVLIVDDVDKGGIRGERWRETGKEPATLLSVMEWIKSDHPDLAFFLTANEVQSLPEAMLRPGRVDHIAWFEPPNKLDRQQILRGYIDFFAPERRPTKAQFDAFVRRSDGLAPAWLREIALQLCYEDAKGVKKILEAVRRMHESPRERTIRARRRKARAQKRARKKTAKKAASKKANS